MRAPLAIATMVMMIAVGPNLAGAGAPAAAVAAQDPGGGHVDCTASVTTPAVTTTSTTYSKVDPLRLQVESASGMSETVTLVLSGSPVDVKVLDTFAGGTFALAPGAAPVGGSSEAQAVSLTFVTDGAPASREHTIDVEWRLASPGGRATIKRGVVNLLYEAGSAGCPFI
jgi:hypothetical protein